ncbi:hypothetical protein STSP_63720 [Streptomyces jeddahensis]|uniref:Uncharacterized protein n=1 Tax=Streptomyces jeddahensis TaxID=1716141 RepID=A0A177HH46_9ACTN|nr:hypothetical protein STSP_63720 [Streptomyces jeddahensis]
MLTFALALKDIAKKLTIKTERTRASPPPSPGSTGHSPRLRRTLLGNPACLLGKRTVSANTRVVSTHDNGPTIRDWLDNVAGVNIADILAHGHCGKQLLEHYAVEVRDDINARSARGRCPRWPSTSMPWPAPTRS